MIFFFFFHRRMSELQPDKVQDQYEEEWLRLRRCSTASFRARLPGPPAQELSVHHRLVLTGNSLSPGRNRQHSSTDSFFSSRVLGSEDTQPLQAQESIPTDSVFHLRKARWRRPPARLPLRGPGLPKGIVTWDGLPV